MQLIEPPALALDHDVAESIAQRIDGGSPTPPAPEPFAWCV